MSQILLRRLRAPTNRFYTVHTSRLTNKPEHYIIHPTPPHHSIGTRRLSTDAATSKIISKPIDGTDGKKSVPFNGTDEQAVIKKLQQTFDGENKTGGIVPVYKRALLYGNRVAIKDSIGEYSYSQLYVGAKKLAQQIDNLCGNGSSTKVAFLCPNSAVYTVVQWACWFSGQIAVPISPKHPINLIEYYIKDSESRLLITVPGFENLLKPLAEKNNHPLLVVDHSAIPASTELPLSLLDPSQPFIQSTTKQIRIEQALTGQFYGKSNAMILYTSGSTGQPKGVVLSHKNLDSQQKSLCSVWDINSKDNLLHILPLNHVHGCINALLCPLRQGARLHMLPQFDSTTVWSVLLNVNMPSKEQITIFMAVPTIYNLLIQEYEKVFSKNERMIQYIRAQCEKNIRLMISGSAPLSTTTFQRWLEISGHRLLERYGMTECGMVLSNPYKQDSVRQRIPGSVGVPLPGNHVKIVSDDGKTIYERSGEFDKGFWSAENSLPVYESTRPTKDKPIDTFTGELYVKGPGVFTEYLNKPSETKSVLIDGWFRTGDIVRCENERFQILGRSSIDIIKTGGYKVSALEIETQLLNHPSIGDVCVVGVPDDTWGQKVAAFIVTKPNTELNLNEFRKWCEEKLANYQVPTVVQLVDKLTRNAMGKLNKKEMLNEFLSETTGGEKVKSV